MKESREANQGQHDRRKAEHQNTENTGTKTRENTGRGRDDHRTGGPPFGFYDVGLMYAIP